jgi:hypothetical protein
MAAPRTAASIVAEKIAEKIASPHSVGDGRVRHLYGPA